MILKEIEIDVTKENAKAVCAKARRLFGVSWVDSGSKCSPSEFKERTEEFSNEIALNFMH